MKSYFEGFEQEDAELIESLSRVAYELRENRKALLEQHEALDEKVLLTKLSSGEIPEHPAYEHYLSAAIMAEMNVAVRSELETILKQAKVV